MTTEIVALTKIEYSIRIVDQIISLTCVIREIVDIEQLLEA